MQGSLQGSQPTTLPCPKEGFEPLPDPRQSFLRPDGSKRAELERARAQLTTKEDLLRQGFGKVHKAFALRVDFEFIIGCGVRNIDAVVFGDVMDGGWRQKAKKMR